MAFLINLFVQCLNPELDISREGFLLSRKAFELCYQVVSQIGIDPPILFDIASDLVDYVFYPPCFILEFGFKHLVEVIS